ncbi:sensor histidine kinase [Lichenifustis flavocetrariae]|uniref:histidine kinase n=1 Tax=Lichenifustis flavocetrariae TaxID=2949735 RepID=A0AA41Z387_9HYPH|nr:sensor histidine kinase [Lichenifustis flavocetrariae]MCW6512191.1 sensor histidine kinase [Lichenifustis flavocetrariae]
MILLRQERDDRAALRKSLAETQEAQRHQQLLINELNHRVKNTLAIIQSIAMQTLRGEDTSPEVREAFMARLMALADAHDILTAESWDGADLRAVIVKAAEVHRDAGGRSRCRLSGPPIRLTPKTAVALSMAFHELATNATKYGSLSIPSGEVDVDWSVERSGDADRLRLIWTERGGPNVVERTRKGFGSRLIERGLAGELAGERGWTFALPGSSARSRHRSHSKPKAFRRDDGDAGARRRGRDDGGHARRGHARRHGLRRRRAGIPA